MNTLMHTARRFAPARRLAIAAAMALLAFCVIGQVAQACPMCKEALSSNSNGGDVISGYFWSILFMMSMPFAMIGSFGLYAYLQVRKARMAQAADQELPQDAA